MYLLWLSYYGTVMLSGTHSMCTNLALLYRLKKCSKNRTYTAITSCAFGSDDDEIPQVNRCVIPFTWNRLFSDVSKTA